MVGSGQVVTLYRHTLRAARAYDHHPALRSALAIQPALHGYTSNLAQKAGQGHALFFLHTPGKDLGGPGEVGEIQRCVQQHFRRSDGRPLSVSLSHGFEVLRALRAGLTPKSMDAPILSAAPSFNSNSQVHPQKTRPSPIESNQSHLLPSGGIRRASSTSPSSRRATPSPRRITPVLAANSSSTMCDSGSVRVNGSGPALRPQLDHDSRIDSHSSTLGLLHRGMVELPKPRTPTPKPTSTQRDPSIAITEDADLEFRLSVYADEYLKLVSSGSEESSDLFLLETSRLKWQAAEWKQHFTQTLSQAQLDELEALVARLGRAVEGGDVEGVVTFAHQFCNPSAVSSVLARAVLSNTSVLDAWIQFLYSRGKHQTLLQLVRLRHRLDVDTHAYRLSRASLCRLMVAACMESEIATSLLLLRESSWGTLAQTAAIDKADPNQQSGIQHSAASHLPSAANRLPSWVPLFYSTPAAAAAAAESNASNSKNALELEDAPDILLARAADGFGVEGNGSSTNASSSSQPAQASSSHPAIQAPKPRLSINLHARTLSGFSTYRVSSSPRSSTPLSSLLNGSILAHTPSAAQTAHHLASISTHARVHQSSTAAIADDSECAIDSTEQPSSSDLTPQPTPLPIIDLWSELGMDSCLMELAILTATRADDRANVDEQTELEAAIEREATRNPDDLAAQIQLSALQHVRMLRQQQAAPVQQSTSTASHGMQPGHQRASSGPATLFERMNEPQVPLAFQLWSVMLQQKLPLSHSYSFAALMGNLALHLPRLADEAAAAASTNTSSSFAPTLPSLLLQTLSTEMRHSRLHTLQHKWMREEIQKWMHTEAEMHLQLASHPCESGRSASTDHIWQCVSILREIQQEGLAAPMPLLSQLFMTVMQGSESGFARSKLLQDLMVICEDFDINMDQLTRIVCGEQMQMDTTSTAN